MWVRDAISCPKPEDAPTEMVARNAAYDELIATNNQKAAKVTGKTGSKETQTSRPLSLRRQSE
jgi:hypothetical protein